MYIKFTCLETVILRCGAYCNASCNVSPAVTDHKFNNSDKKIVILPIKIFYLIKMIERMTGKIMVCKG